MHALDKSFVRVVAIASVSLLTGCLVSETALLDESNGRERPIEPGLYQSCSYSDDEPDGDCTNLRISIDDTHLYQMVDDEDETLFVRFRKIGHGAYLAQTLDDEEDDDGYMYFVAAPEDGAFSMTMILCADLPEKLKSDLVSSGELEIESDGEVCVAKTLDAALAAAKAYRGDDAPPARSRLQFIPVADKQE